MISKNTPLKEVLKLAHPCRCHACSNGCRYGSGFLAGDDAKNLAKFLGIGEEELKQKYLEEAEQFSAKLLRPKLKRKQGMPYGKCIFFGEKEGCKVHEAKPLQCRISMGCKDYGKELTLWFMHNCIVNENDEKSMKEFNVYLKSGGKTLK